MVGMDTGIHENHTMRNYTLYGVVCVCVETLQHARGFAGHLQPPLLSDSGEQMDSLADLALSRFTLTRRGSYFNLKCSLGTFLGT